MNVESPSWTTLFACPQPPLSAGLRAAFAIEPLPAEFERLLRQLDESASDRPN